MARREGAYASPRPRPDWQLLPWARTVADVCISIVRSVAPRRPRHPRQHPLTLAFAHSVALLDAPQIDTLPDATSGIPSSLPASHTPLRGPAPRPPRCARSWSRLCIQSGSRRFVVVARPRARAPVGRWYITRRARSRPRRPPSVRSSTDPFCQPDRPTKAPSLPPPRGIAGPAAAWPWITTTTRRYSASPTPMCTSFFQ